jgi:TonB family protein
MFRGLRIRQPEAQRTAMVIIAAMLVVAAIGTTLLSRSSRRQHDVVKASTAPVPTASAADIQNAVQEASAHAAAPQTTAAQTVTPPPKKKSAPLEDEVVTRVRTKPVPAAVLSNAVAPDENSAPQAQRAQIIGEPLFRVNPEYPKEAIARHLEGNVVLSAILDKQGRVQTVSVISGDPIFRAAAINAVKQWKYAPTVINGEAMEAETQVTVAFVLER